MKLFNRIFKQSNDESEMNAYLSNRLHVVKSEEIDGVYYWYDAQSGQFLAQGKTDDEIRSTLQDLWTEHIFVVSDRHMIMGPDLDQLIAFD